MRIKKLTSLAVMAMALIMCVPTAAYAYKIKSGDYVYLGTYNEKPIVWRAVGDTADGTLEIISDKILSIKAFDARRIASDDENIRLGGSSRWAVSALRNWLNSESITSVKYLNGNTPVNGAVTVNEYEKESGFLAGFSETERGYIVKKKNLSALNALDIENTEIGSEEHIYSREAETAATNFSAAYAEETEDMIYLPTSEDIEYIKNNFRTFGVDYHKAMPTSEAVDKSNMKYSGLRADNSWYYWLADAMEGLDTSLVRLVTPVSSVEYGVANDGNVGVRPMCSLDINAIGIRSGNGTKNSPYVLFNDPWIDMDGDENVMLSGAEETITFYKSNLPDGAVVEIYHNNNLILTDPASQFKVTALSGVNHITAVVVEKNGDTLCSKTYNFQGIELIEAKTLEINETFDDSTKLSFYKPASSQYVSYEYTTVDRNGEEDGVLIMDSTQGVTASLATYGNKLKSTYEYAFVEAEFKFTSFGDASTSLLPIALNTGGSKYEWWSPLEIQTDGILNITGVDKGRNQIGYIEKNVWYDIKLIINNVKNTITVVLTDEREDNPKILCYDLAISKDFEYVYYMNVSVRGTSDSHQTIQLSTLKVGGAELAGSVGMIGNINIKPDGKTVRVFVKNTSEDYLAAKLIGAVYENDGTLKDAYVCDVSLLSQNGMTYELPFKSALGKTDNVRIFLFDSDSGVYPLTLSDNYSLPDN